jgi:hypothetical protein
MLTTPKQPNMPGDWLQLLGYPPHIMLLDYMQEPSSSHQLPSLEVSFLPLFNLERKFNIFSQI